MSRAVSCAEVAGFPNAKGITGGETRLRVFSRPGFPANMSPQYIPAGRTSIVKKGRSEFQMQTEYAGIPHPRITTTIFSEGQVLHKIEKVLEKDIETIEEMHQIEDIIKAQHLEVSKVIRERGVPASPGNDIVSKPDDNPTERIRQLEVVEQVFRITSDGKIADSNKITREFKNLFKHILKELPQMIMVFAALPGQSGHREEGIYEIEPGRILLASKGDTFFLILIKSGTPYETVAAPLKAILNI